MKAVVFDFDGLILDTEIPVFRSWQHVYSEHGVDLGLDEWRSTIGTDTLDPAAELERRVGRSLDHDAIGEVRRRHRDDLQARETIRPGVLEWLEGCERLHLAAGVASSSSSAWVVGHLTRLGIVDRFDCIRCRDHVSAAKPDPVVYRSVLEALGVEGSSALAVEDSVPGVAAAKAAGMFAVAVPGALTRGMDYGAADVVLPSLAHASLESVLERLGPG